MKNLVGACCDGTLFDRPRHVLDDVVASVERLATHMSQTGYRANSNWEQTPRCPVHVTAGFNFHANFAFNMFDSDGKAENGIEMVAMTMTLFPPFRFHLSFKMVDMPVIILDIDTHDETVKFEHGGTRDETRDVLVKFLDPTGKGYSFLLPDEAEIHNVS